MILRNSLLFAVLLGSGTSFAFAQKAQPTLEMSADGEIQIAPNGHVDDYRLHSKLTPAIADAVDRKVRSWSFEPVLVDGVAVTAKTSMHLTLTAEPITGKDEYTLRVAQVRFGELGRAIHTKPPKYPPTAVRSHVGGKVMLAIRVDETGKVVEALPYQTSLDVRTSSEAEAEQFRRLLEEASVAAAHSWRYDPSETINGKAIGMSALVPIVYTLCNSHCSDVSKGEQWRALIPGPVHPVPWMHKQQVADNLDLSSLEDGQAMSLDSRFQLKDNVIGKTL